MIASIVLLVCLAAIAVAAGIVFIVFGPIPVNRRVTMVSRISAPMPTAAGPIAMPGMPVFDPAQASFTPAQPLPAQPEPFAAVEPPPARKAKPLAPIAPVQLRRPRTAPSPLPRVRSARGTEPRNPALPVTDAPRFEVEHTAQDIPMFDADEMTFIEDERS